MSDLEGRIALVTGGAQGIGAAAARALAAAGATVNVTDIAAPDTVANDIGGLSLALDVTQEAAWAETIAIVDREVGGLDILVNNAGMMALNDITQTDLVAWRRIQAVNVEGTMLGCKHAVPLIARRASRWNGGGSIINMSSIAGLRGGAGFTAYAASKAAILAISKCLALELADRRIRVNSVHPGFIVTEMGLKLAAELENKAGPRNGAEVESHVFAKSGTVENVADMIVFLASDKAAFIAGTQLVIDGGATT